MTVNRPFASEFETSETFEFAKTLSFWCDTAFSLQVHGSCSMLFMFYQKADGDNLFSNKIARIQFLKISS
jgi:hypothetical protein